MGVKATSVQKYQSLSWRIWERKPSKEQQQQEKSLIATIVSVPSGAVSQLLRDSEKDVSGPLVSLFGLKIWLISGAENQGLYPILYAST